MITEECYKKIMSDVVEFNRFLANYTEIILQRVMLEVPDLVLYHIKNTQEMAKIKETFFKKNPELTNHIPLVAQTANKLQVQHLNWTPQKVFEKAAEEVNQLISEESSNAQGL